MYKVSLRSIVLRDNTSLHTVANGDCAVIENHMTSVHCHTGCQIRRRYCYMKQDNFNTELSDLKAQEDLTKPLRTKTSMCQRPTDIVSLNVLKDKKQ